MESIVFGFLQHTLMGGKPLDKNVMSVMLLEQKLFFTLVSYK